MEQINIATLLKDCPSGMELDCLIYDNVYFKCIRDHAVYPIVCYTIDSKGEKEEITFNWYGKYALTDTAKCIIFPKGKTTWEGFVPPYKFNYGDIVVNASNKDSNAFIYAGENDKYYKCYVGLATGTNPALLTDGSGSWVDKKSGIRPATEEEKEKLFQAIKDNGYKWNAETKALKKLVKPKFHVGDWVVNRFGNVWHIDSFHSKYYQMSNGNRYCFFLIEEQDEMHLWTINDAKDGDVLACNEEILLFKSYSAPGYISLYCWYNGQTNNFHSREVTNALLTTINKICPVTKKQYDLLFTKIKETGYEWVAETKTLVRLIQPKFKIGDKVIHKNNRNVIFTITNIENDYYICRAKKVAFGFHDQDNYELVNEPKFNDGDIITDNRGNICIYKGPMSYNKNLIGFYCGYRITDNAFIFKHLENKHFGDINEYRFASEEEKAKIFRIIKQNGYKWNSETKILEKLIIQKFKVGDRIKYKNGIEQGVILSITDNTYYDVAVINNIGISVRIIDQDEWELIPNKFDINTLIPFESKVLVRHDKDNKWTGSFFSFIDRDLNSHCYKFVTTADKSYPMMIPYKGNEYLLGKVEDCKDFYKIWE